MSEVVVAEARSRGHPRCNGCGRYDLPTRAYRCTWPDQRVTVERHCHVCRLTWHRQLRALGAELHEIADDEQSSDRAD